MNSPKPTIKDVVNGTPEGQAAVQHAMEESAKAMDGPTDSEQLEARLIELSKNNVFTEEAVPQIVQLIQERDQQRLSAALGTLPKKLHGCPNHKQPSHLCSRVECAIAYRHNLTIDQCRVLITAALGPDNSKIEE